MQKLTKEDLYSLEEYSAMRSEFRAKMIEHKKSRVLRLGEHATVHFEDRTLMHYQVQEMLRAEKVFDAEGIQEEIDAYNPLIPDGSNWKATFMLEYDDEEIRRKRLGELIGIEKTVWVAVDGFDKVYPICNEDLERETEDKTSSVHFMRFELNADMVKAVKSGTAIAAGIEHEKYSVKVDAVTDAMRTSLAGDLD
ncbi:MAG: DUF3501 family protein [Gammaproteobacteria bacterium]|nr:DUF3501 family protein [Gammaproteobacteria bacterium]